MRQIKILEKMLLNELMEALESEIETNEYPNYPSIPAAFLERKFRDEHAWREEQVGLFKAVKDWLQGLVLPIPFENYKVFKKFGEPLGHKDMHDFADIYWETLTRVTCDVIQKYRLDVVKMASGHIQDKMQKMLKN